MAQVRRLTRKIKEQCRTCGKFQKNLVIWDIRLTAIGRVAKSARIINGYQSRKQQKNWQRQRALI